jgi:DUF4097 and DUF4098 domain-containing protein YvlB
MRWAQIWLGAVLALLALPVTVAAQQQIDVREAIEPDAYLRVYMETEGFVRIAGWDRDSIAFAGTADAALDEFRFGVGKKRASGKGGLWDEGRTGGSANLEVWVPRGATLWVKTTGASVEIVDVTGGVDVYSVTGDVKITGSPKQLYTESMGGEVTISGNSSSVRAKTGSGPITFRGAGEDVTLLTVGGTITVSGPSLRRGHFESVTGDISFDGALEPGSSVGFQTHSGVVDLTLPRDAGADCTVTSIDGEVQVDFPTAGERERNGARGPRREFTIGDGGATVTIQTFDGSVAIRPR